MTEDQLEQEVLGWLADIGYTPVNGYDIAPDGPAAERADYVQPLLFHLIYSLLRLPEAEATLGELAV